MAPLTDKIFVITGAGGALAGSIARSFAHAGARLVLVDRHESTSPSAPASITPRRWRRI